MCICICEDATKSVCVPHTWQCTQEQLKMWVNYKVKNKHNYTQYLSRMGTLLRQADRIQSTCLLEEILCFSQSHMWADKYKFCYQMKHCDVEGFCSWMVIISMCIACFTQSNGRWKKQWEIAGLFLPQKLLTADKDQWHCWWYTFWAASLYWSGCNAFGSQDGRWS